MKRVKRSKECRRTLIHNRVLRHRCYLLEWNVPEIVIGPTSLSSTFAPRNDENDLSLKSTLYGWIEVLYIVYTQVALAA